MWEIRRYTPDRKEEWDAFVDSSRNATFLFRRGYMDYHADRFTDHSLMAFRNGRLAALLPANIRQGTLFSHEGLTYGGWALSRIGLDATDIFLLWRAWLEYCHEEKITMVVYKPLPYIYAEMPSQEDLYMLFLCGAKIGATDISTAIDLTHNPGMNKLQRRHLRKSLPDFYGHIITTDTPAYVALFHSMLVSCLQERHGAAPVHSLGELQMLMSRFPENIRIWGAFSDAAEGMLAGVCAYETPLCVHCQYIATSPEGRAMNMLVPLIAQMTERYAGEGVRYFDFGISNEDGGRLLNPGLNRQKTSYGGSGVAYTRWRIDVAGALNSLPERLWPRL